MPITPALAHDDSLSPLDQDLSSRPQGLNDVRAAQRRRVSPIWVFLLSLTLVMIGAGCNEGGSLVGTQDQPSPTTPSPTHVPDPLLEESRAVASVPPNLMPREATEASVIAALRDHLATVARVNASRDVLAIIYLRDGLPSSQFCGLIQQYRLHGGSLANLGVTFRKHIPSDVHVPSWSEYLHNPSMGADLIPREEDGGIRIKAFPTGDAAAATCDSVVTSVLRDPGPVSEPYRVDASSTRIASARIYGTLGDLLQMQSDQPSVRAVGVISLSERADLFIPYWRPYRAGEPLR